ncbi:MAG TPA: hypothetical protein VHA82_00580 [Ramlibacter sp.]|uniref:beta strand repeat-containing protein n=1 Tax=Ramlibacter sp. TaxID=1917967 RepID=UPI002C06FAE5|nr:hypothetical protein [Ramlibacter sp.]HVZ42275.1 hypothetical protein [Ramlibacter sp.]
MRGNQRNTGIQSHGAEQFRRTALASACVIVLGGAAAGGAHAQLLNYQITPDPTTGQIFSAPSYEKQVTNNQWAQNPSISASNSIGLFGTLLPVGGPIVVDGNSSLVTAIGNEVSPLVGLDPTVINLFVMSSGGTAGILSGQLRGAAAAATPVQTTANNDSLVIGVQNTAQADAQITVSNNKVGSTVLVNSADSRLSGQLPIGYSNAQLGSIDASTGINGTAQDVTTTGSLNINANQTAYNASGQASSAATITNSTVTIGLTDSGTPLTNPLTLTSNSMATSFGVNAANNLVSVTSGGAAQLSGTITVSNAQVNLEDAGAGAVPTASVDNKSSVNVDLSASAGQNTVLQAPLVVTNNSISAASTGNSTGVRGAGNSVAASNAITLATGMDAAGSGSGTVNDITASATSVQTTTVNQADLGLLNRQINSGTFLSSDVQAPITTKVDTLDPAASITNTSNSISSTTRGNIAGNLISASNSNFSASTGVANAQVNNLTSTSNIGLSSTITGAPISITVGNAASGAVGGTITSNSNTIGTTTEGNVAQSTVSITSSNVTSTATAGDGQSLADANTGHAAVNAGSSATNIQSNFGPNAIVSTVDSSGVTVTTTDIDGGTGPLGLAAATITMDKNAITSNAAGNIGTTSVLLAGSNATVHQGVASVQQNGAAVTAATTNSGVIVSSGSGGTTTVAASTVGVTNNTVSSAAQVNDATNTVTANFSNLTPGAVGTNPASNTGAVSDIANITATSNASLGIANAQSNTADSSASTVNTGGFAVANMRDPANDTPVTGSTFTISGNTASASNGSNRASNAIAMPANSTITPPGGVATDIASIANVQSNAGNASVATVDNTSAATTGFGLTYFPSLDTTTATVQKNSASALSLGNQASNSLTSSGGSLTTAAPLATGVSTADSGTSNVSANGEYAISNSQKDDLTTGRTAQVLNTTAGVFASPSTASAGAVTNSTLTVANNALTAEARNNDTANTLSLTGYANLKTAAGIANSQVSSSPVAANVTDGSTGIKTISGNGTDTITGSTLAITDNTISGLAVGSSGSNKLKIDASTLSGNSTVAVAGVTGGAAPVASADYTIASEQAQTGGAASAVTGVARLSGAQDAANGADVTGGSVAVVNNTLSAFARGTDVSNTLTLNGTGTATVLTGALGSGQTGDGNITASVAPSAGYNDAVGADALSFTTTPVNVTKNTISASASRNFGSNTQTVTGATVTGIAPAAGNTDFTVVSTQNHTGGDVTSNVDPGVVGAVVYNALTTNTTTVTQNKVQSFGTENIAGNALTITASNANTTSGMVNNTQTSDLGAVAANVGSTVPADIGVTSPTTAGPVLTTANIIVSGNTVNAQAGRNSAGNSVAISGSTITGNGDGIAQDYRTINTQSDKSDGATDSSATLGTVGAKIATDTGASTLTVTSNSLTSGTTGNAAANTQTLTAAGALTASGLVSNTQDSGTGATAPGHSSTVAVTTVGVNSAGALAADTVSTISSNTLTAQTLRNSADNALTASGSSITGTIPTGAAASFTSSNVQHIAGDVTATNTATTLGVQTDSTVTTTTGQVTVTDNTLLARARGNTSASTGTTVELTAPNTITGSAMATSTQDFAGGTNVGAINSTAGGGVNIGLSVTNTSDTMPVTVTGNMVQSESKVNNAVTGLKVTGGTVTGDVPTATLPAGTPASFSAINSQDENANGAVSGGVNANTSTGVIGATANTFAGTNVLTASNNSLLATARGNEAQTSAAITATNSLSGIGLASNTQTSTNNTETNANVSTGTIGQLSATSTNNNNVTVNSNLLQGDGVRNQATTTLTATGGSVAGAGFADLTTTTTPASFTASNSQTVNVGTDGSNANVSPGNVGIDATTGVVTGVNTVTANANTFTALAGDNAGTTKATVAATGALTGTAMATSTQQSLAGLASVNSNGGVNALLNEQNIGLVSGTGANSITVTTNGNASTAQSIRQAATTTLDVSGGSVTGDQPPFNGTTQAAFSAVNNQTDLAGGTLPSVYAQTARQVIGASLLSGDLTSGAGANTVTVTNNTDTALARANSAATSASVTATGAVTGSALTDSTQSSLTPAIVQADAIVDLSGVRILAGNANDLTVTVGGGAQKNTVTAEATRNVAQNTLTVTGGSVTGDGADQGTALAGGQPASFTARNNQGDVGSGGSFANANLGMGFGLDVEAGDLLGTNRVTVSGNAVQAQAGANLAVTNATVTAGAAVVGTARAESTQNATATTNAYTALANTSLIGLNASGPGNAGNVPVTVTGNSQSAQAISNSATNGLVVSGTSVTGDVTLVGGTTASFTTNNQQSDLSTNGALATNTYGTVGATVGSISGAVVTATGNAMTALARNNSANNSATITGSGAVSGSAATENTQSALAGGVNITHTGGTVGLVAATPADNVTVTSSDNTLTSEGIRNVATNGLTVTGAAITGTAAGALTNANASFTASNNQTEAGAVNSVVGNTVTTVGANVTAGDFTGTNTITASSNTVSSIARANSAGTTLTVQSGSTLSGSGVSSNVQTAGSTADLSGSFSVGTVGATNTGDITGPITVTASGNTLTAEGRRNVSSNKVDVNGVAIVGESDLSLQGASFVGSNNQTASNGANTTKANATVGIIGLNVGDDLTTSGNITASNNVVQALGGGNSSTNTVSVKASGTLTGSALNTSTQDATAGDHSSTLTVGTVGANFTSDTTTSPVTVTNNILVSQTLRNAATNALAVSGSTVTGETGANLDVAGTKASFMTDNFQTGNADATATSTVTTVGATVGGNIDAGVGTSFTTTNNAITARAGTNTAANSTDLGGATVFAGTALTQSNQVAGAAATVNATVAVGTVGGAIVGDIADTASTHTVNNNLLDATAVQNVASNTLTLSGATVSATSLATGANSAFAVDNTQTAGAAATATNDVVTLGVTAGSVSGNVTAYSITKNNVFARSGANSADNSITLTPASGLDNTTTSSIDNSQTSLAGTISSSVNANQASNIGVAVTGDTTPTAITVANNALNAQATRNAATSILNASGPSIAGGDLLSGSQSYAVRSTQNGTGDVTSVTYTGLLGANLGTAAGGGVVFGVVDNSMIAMATMNSATNKVLLNSGSALSGSATNGTASVSNTQNANAASTISATVGGASAATPTVPTMLGVTSGAVGNAIASPITVTGNTLAAQGGGNTALNAIEAGASSSIGGSAPTYTYQVLNNQTNDATVNMRAQYANVGAVLTGALGASSINVSGNTASAIGYGNNAVNSINISGLAGGVNASASVVNNQLNTANVTSVATNLNIGVTGTAAGSSAGGSTIVTNNSITARAVGNSAQNSINTK